MHTAVIRQADTLLGYSRRNADSIELLRRHAVGAALAELEALQKEHSEAMQAAGAQLRGRRVATCRGTRCCHGGKRKSEGAKEEGLRLEMCAQRGMVVAIRPCRACLHDPRISEQICGTQHQAIDVKSGRIECLQTFDVCAESVKGSNYTAQGGLYRPFG